MAELSDKIISKTALARFVTKIRQKFLPLSGGTVTGNLTVNGTLSPRGGVELYGITPYIDFHYASTTADYTSRIAEYNKGVLHINDTLFVNSSKQVAVGVANFDQSLYVDGAAVLSYDKGGNTSLYLRGGISQSSWENGFQGFSLRSDGNATFAAAVTCQRVSQTSDRRVKRGIRPVRGSDTDRVRDVPIIEYAFRKDKDGTRRYGVTAQEVEKAGLKNLVTEDGGGMKSVDYTALLCLKVHMLERRVEALESGVPEAQAAPVRSGKGRLSRWLPWRKEGRG